MRLEKSNINAELKYKEALTLYSDTMYSIKDICERTGVGFSAFTSYLSKHRRDLILKRYNLTDLNSVKLRGKRGQTTVAHHKYKDAIAACDSKEYIEYNISQVARIFGIDASSLASQLRRHYPWIVPRREKERQRMGIAVNLQYGVRRWTKDGYVKAVEMLQTSDMTIKEVANLCDVSYTGLREHILAYHPQITELRKNKRTEVIGQKIRGKRNGNWIIHQPSQSTTEKYAEAIELYKTTSMDVEEIVRKCGVNLGGFRYFLRTWHPELMVQRRGFDEGINLEQTKRYKKSTAEKYAKAIEKLRTYNLSIPKVANEFGLNPDTFRRYLKEHYPELLTVRGKVKASNGKMVVYQCEEKYAKALHIYQTTSESLKSIANRLGLTYNSLGGFVRRNYPEAIEKHKLLQVASKKINKNDL